jgi:hypothetical protein
MSSLGMARLAVFDFIGQFSTLMTCLRLSLVGITLIAKVSGVRVHPGTPRFSKGCQDKAFKALSQANQKQSVSKAAK